MNVQIRRLAVGILVLYSALFVRLNVVQVYSAGDLNVRVYEDRGKLAQLESFHPEVLEKLREKALLDGVVASARIEGLAPDVQAVRAAVRDNAYGDDEMAQRIRAHRARRGLSDGVGHR